VQVAWFIALISAVCLEGLGRRYLPGVPAAVFYFFKDVVLILGYILFRPPASVTRVLRHLYRGFGMVWLCGVGWTIAEMFNPEQRSLLLAGIGFRSYWLWWIAPPVIASALRNQRVRDRAILILVLVAVGVSALAALQFAAPANSDINMYAVWNGQAVYAADVATVASTGRARVASTFTFLSGFVAFTVLVPALLLSLGLDSRTRLTRTAALTGTFVTAAVVPMSGSRSAIVEGAVVLLVALWSTGLFFTRVGRRILLGALVAAVLAGAAYPDAMLGVQSRFDNVDETESRFIDLATVLPPVILTLYDYPFGGLGTGMEQNARISFGFPTAWDVESENGRCLFELGPIGYLLVWTSKLGLMVALLRASRFLKATGRRGSAAAALSFAALTMFGSIAFDHNWQALFFLGCGFILAEIVSVRSRMPASGSLSFSDPSVAAQRPIMVAGRPAQVTGSLRP
jgi:hypothetical protein